MQFGKATRKGLPFKAKIPKVDEEGIVKARTDEAWHSVKSGLVKGTSIGFLPQEYKYKDDGGTHFEKAAVHELSLTAIPCNPEAMITAFKSLQESEGADVPAVPPQGDPAPQAGERTPVAKTPRSVAIDTSICTYN